MKTFIINGKEVTFESCTATAHAIGYTEPTNALYIHDAADEFCDGDGVIFDEMPETDEEAADLLFNYDLITDSKVLETVIRED